MFALRFRFLAGRYHATPWGRNVNEADIAWPPEPWRLLRALIAAYWRKGGHLRWAEDSLAQLIDILSETLPAYRLPEGAIHAHTRHYMPQAQGKKTLVFDAFVRLPDASEVVAAWPDVTLNDELLSLAADLAASVGYLGRAESWTDCETLADWHGGFNCAPRQGGSSGNTVRLLASLSPDAYAAERDRLITVERQRISLAAKKSLSTPSLNAQVARAFRSKNSGADTLPERLVDALSLDTADWQDCGWPRPPASREIVYTREDKAAVGVVPRSVSGRPRAHSEADAPTVARYLLAGRPLPRVEETVKIGELMRRAALAQFGWRHDDASGRRAPAAPWQISGRGADGKPLGDPSHSHAFWLPEDADSDGLIDHIAVFVAGGIERDIRAKLDRITRLWLEPSHQVEDDENTIKGTREWRLALEGFGKVADFSGGTGIFGRSTQWRSITPFLAAGHLKAGGYAAELRRLVKRTELDRRFGFEAAEIKVSELTRLQVGGASRGTLHFHRFRSRGHERQYDAAGVFLNLVFPVPVDGPIALGYGSHFGLGLFSRG